MKKGQSLIELLIIIGLLAVLLPSILTGWVTSREGVPQQKQRLDASTYLKEVSEAIRSVRDNGGWNALPAASSTNNTYYYHERSGNTWTLTGVTDINYLTANGYLNSTNRFNGFYEKIIVNAVNRDMTTGAIVTTGGTTDPSTKKFDITITWTTPHNSTATSSFYLTRQEDFQHVETTQADFNANGKDISSVKVQASTPLPIPTPDDGEIVLSQTGGFGDWCNPAPTPIAKVNLDGNGVPHAVSAIQIGSNINAAVAEGDNASGVTYAGINITDPPNPIPPVGSFTNATSYSANPPVKANGIFNDTTYGYLAAVQHGKKEQGIIIRLSDYKKIATLDLNTNDSGQSIYASNNIAYLATTDNKLYTFNISTLSTCTDTSPCTYPPAASISLNGNALGKKVIVVGNYAYLAVDSSSNQLQIVDVSHPIINPLPNPISVSVDGQGGQDIFVNIPQSRAYLITTQSSTQPEFFLINLTNNSVLGSYDTQAFGDMNPTGVVAVSGAKVIIVGAGGQQYQVLRVDDESNPTHCGGLYLPNDLNGIATVFSSNTNRAFSYIIEKSATSGQEFQVIEGGPGGSGSGDYVPTGTFTSAPFGPMTINTAFNRFVANISQPVVDVGSGFYGVKLQMAVADPTGGGSCLPSDGANYTFVGTDSTDTGTTHYFTTTNTGTTSISGSIPFGNYATNYKNPSKCFRYQLTLNTNHSTLTPVFKDITVNYSP